jgi:hypothetical protein
MSGFLSLNSFTGVSALAGYGLRSTQPQKYNKYEEGKSLDDNPVAHNRI